jgi:NhaA family Na+:H+ antiporter
MIGNKRNKLNADGGIIYAPWERTLSKMLSPFEDFVRHQTAGGILLIAAAVIAIFLANSSIASWYEHFIHTPVALNFGSWSLQMSLYHWINDAMMALFFFVVGLELKREMMVGELSDIRQAALPAIAAVGGMVVPALIYIAFNHQGDALLGWGVPMATDIAFAVGVLALLSSRVPRALITFLVALAIVDDLGAVLVIALFYSQEVSLLWLLSASALVFVLLTFNYSGVRKTMPYFIVAVLLWYALLQSGVHPTLAGVLGAFTVPARSKYDPSLFADRVKEQIQAFITNKQSGSSILSNHSLYAVVQNIESSAVSVQTPLQRLESSWHFPVAFLVIPIFALFNAGIPLDLSTLKETFVHPVTLGAMFGLVLGKFIGISGASWIGLRLGIAKLPTGTRFSQLAATSVLGGIGFTMSIFIADLAFKKHADYLLMAKTGVFAGSLIAGVIGFIVLFWLGRKDIRI